MNKIISTKIAWAVLFNGSIQTDTVRRTKRKSIEAFSPVAPDHHLYKKIWRRQQKLGSKLIKVEIKPLD